MIHTDFRVKCITTRGDCSRGRSICHNSDMDPTVSMVSMDMEDSKAMGNRVHRVHRVHRDMRTADIRGKADTMAFYLPGFFPQGAKTRHTGLKIVLKDTQIWPTYTHFLPACSSINSFSSFNLSSIFF